MFREGENVIKPCTCGFGEKKSIVKPNNRKPTINYCPNTNKLDNHVDCPSFDAICHEDNPCEPYWRLIKGALKQVRRWCLMGEIVEVDYFIRPKLTIRTRFDEKARVHFYLEEDTHARTFSFDDALVGHTMLIVNPEKHDFQDMTTGIRQEDGDLVVIFKCSMQTLIRTFGLMMNSPVCFQCETKPSNDQDPQLASSAPTIMATTNHKENTMMKTSAETVHRAFETAEKNYFDKLKSKTLAKQICSDNQKHPSNTNNFQKVSMDFAKTYHCQSGILTPFDLYEHALYIIIYLTNEGDVEVMKACGNLSKLKDKLSQIHSDCRLEATLGLGYLKTQQWLSRTNIALPKFLIEFKEKQGPTGKMMPSTGGDILVHIRSNRKDLCFELGRQFYQSIPNICIARLDDTFGYAYMSSKTNGLSQDFTGFEDGNENPNSMDQRVKAALIGEDEDSIHVGGSYALTQKWKHNLIKWDVLTQEEQANVIGRTKGEDSKKIRPKIPTSHVSRTDLKENGKDIKVVRQSLPYGDLKEHGLFFISYASNSNKHEKQLDSMLGIKDGIYDRIMDFSTPITGNYWFIPSIDLLHEIFNSTN